MLELNTAVGNLLGHEDLVLRPQQKGEMTMKIKGVNENKRV